MGVYHRKLPHFSFECSGQQQPDEQRYVSHLLPLLRFADQVLQEVWEDFCNRFSDYTARQLISKYPKHAQKILAINGYFSSMSQ
jgi:hypothetical protein